MDKTHNKNIDDNQSYHQKKSGTDRGEKPALQDAIILLLSKCYFGKVVNLLIIFSLGVSTLLFYRSQLQTQQILAALQKDLWVVKSIPETMVIPNLRSLGGSQRGITFADEQKNMQQILPMYSHEKDTVFFLLELPQEYWFYPKNISVLGEVTGESNLLIIPEKLEYFTTGHLLLGLPTDEMSILTDYIDLNLKVLLNEEMVRFTFVW